MEYVIAHSAKGSTWKNHKYTAVKMVNGKKRYVYDQIGSAAKSVSDKMRLSSQYVFVNKKHQDTLSRFANSDKALTQKISNLYSRPTAEEVRKNEEKKQNRKIVKASMDQKLSSIVPSSETKKKISVALKSVKNRSITSQNAEYDYKVGKGSITIYGRNSDKLKRKRWENR